MKEVMSDRTRALLQSAATIYAATEYQSDETSAELTVSAVGKAFALLEEVERRATAEGGHEG